ncbi:MAG TPA: hypothetical protein VMW92_04855 [Candidatus Heimdallarchaeota archaeon]|nr:hypothetical protein [Candidatus Heimdallarchaeota archaeon]
MAHEVALSFLARQRVYAQAESHVVVAAVLLLHRACHTAESPSNTQKLE